MIIGATYLRIGLNDVVPCNTPSRAVRHALTLVILLARSELREKSIDDEHLSTNDLPQRRGWVGGGGNTHQTYSIRGSKSIQRNNDERTEPYRTFSEYAVQAFLK